MTAARTLVAGVGNIFLGDDGFGVEVVRRLASRPLQSTVSVVDFGIRGLDLAYALLDGYEDVILVDAVTRGRAPGTVFVLEVEPADLQRHGGAVLDAHAVVPTRVLALAAELGGRELLGRIRVVGCEPALIPSDDAIQVGLSEPVAAAVDTAVELVESLLAQPDA